MVGASYQRKSAFSRTEYYSQFFVFLIFSCTISLKLGEVEESERTKFREMLKTSLILVTLFITSLAPETFKTGIQLRTRKCLSYSYGSAAGFMLRR